MILTMHSQEIRNKFLKYFESKKHSILPSSPTVPHNDPTLLFTNAGMNQFKDLFLGDATRDYTRATTTQKCIRVGGKHNDLDNVGHTRRHATFFEMLGNFSFGDYFKEEAIDYAWDVSTNVYEFDPKFLWISVYEKDDESFELWKKHISEDRIVRIGEKDNFWSMGDVGPCGPCTELFYDRGANFGNATSPSNDTDGERFVEFWNLVFMQYNREKSGKLVGLPKQSVDTGSGLERVVALKMGVTSLFQTDILMSLIRKIESRFSLKYDESNTHTAPAFHVIADHIRTLAFAIADGAEPSNVDRGYVLRKVLRRAVRYGRLLGLEKPFLADVLPELITQMGNDFPEIKTAENRIAEILTLEEEGFLTTLRRGGNILQTIVQKAEKTPQKQINGEDAFKLKDTYGFPIEEVLLIAKDASLTVNLDSYALLEEKARELSRSSRKVEGQTASKNLFTDFTETCQFIGYDNRESDTSVLAIVKDDTFVDTLNEGEEGIILLEETPFYAEMGGQMADNGAISNTASQFTVHDCQSPLPNVIAHIGTLEKGTITSGDSVCAAIDIERRHHIENHHTATHLLHFALFQVLGEHIRQAGSLVETDRLRFDFSHHKGVTQEEIRAIEKIVNVMIREGKQVDSYELALSEVQKIPEIKQFFGDKYGQTVRVVDIDESKELCGGTHVDNTSRIGLFRIVKESSIAKGVRRIEAVTGYSAEKHMYDQEDRLSHIAGIIDTPIQKVEEKATSISDEVKSLRSELKALRASQMGNMAQELLNNARDIFGIQALTAQVSVDAKEFGPLCNDLIDKLGSGTILLANESSGRCMLAIRASNDVVAKGFKAGDAIKQLAPLMGGSGGGKPGSAQAGGTDLSKFDEIATQFTTYIEQCLKN
jgi:alanyl-tRNA synthetase